MGGRASDGREPRVPSSTRRAPHDSFSTKTIRPRSAAFITAATDAGYPGLMAPKKRLRSLRSSPWRISRKRKDGPRFRPPSTWRWSSASRTRPRLPSRNVPSVSKRRRRPQRFGVPPSRAWKGRPFSVQEPQWCGALNPRPPSSSTVGAPPPSRRGACGPCTTSCAGSTRGQKSLTALFFRKRCSSVAIEPSCTLNRGRYVSGCLVISSLFSSCVPAETTTVAKMLDPPQTSLLSTPLVTCRT